MTPIRRAILSVYRKEGLVELAGFLADRGVEIISSGGTASTLAASGVPVTPVHEHTGFPEILDGRVKTLHPRVAGGLLGRPELDEHRRQMEQHDIPPIDLVVVNLYPFEEVTADPDCSLERALENIDIGGPTLIRAAAKNHPRVAVVVDPEDYSALIEDIRRNEGAVGDPLRTELARKAFRRTASYDAAIAAWLASDEPFPEQQLLDLRRLQELRYGENPHQAAALYAEAGYRGPGVANARQLGGKALSYNNLADADSALAIVRGFEAPAAVIVKHGNPCGAAQHSQLLANAFEAARQTDPMSAFGGIVALNRTVDLATAEAIAGTFFEVVLAPGFDEAAVERLRRKKALRLLEITDFDAVPRGGLDLKRIRGGFLLAQWDESGETTGDVVTRRAPTDVERRAMAFSWRLVKHVRSNAIVLAREDQAVGIGAGQMSRVDAVHLAVHKAQLPTAGCALASDAFFPFRDGLDAAADAGVTAVIQPGGSVRDPEVIEAADERGVAMIFTGVRHFRH